MEYFAYFLVFFVPLFTSQAHWFPAGTPKSLFIVGSVLMMLPFIFWGLVSKRHSPTWEIPVNWLHLVLGLYFLILTISALCGVDPMNSFFGRYELSLSLVLLYALGALAYIVGFLASKNKNFTLNLILASFLSSVVVAIVAFFKNSSTIGNDSYVGAYLLFNFCFGLGLLLKASKIWHRVLLGLGLITIAICPIFFNVSILQGQVSLSSAVHQPLLLLGTAMGATLGLVVALAASFLLLMFRNKNKTVKYSAATLFGIFIVGMFLTGHQLVTPGSKVYETYVSAKTPSRFIFWDIANSGFKERPALGWGFGNYSNVYQKYFNPEIMSTKYTEEVWVSQPHNIIWEDLSNTGILGTASFLILFGFLLYILFRGSVDEEGRIRPINVLLFGGLIGYLVQNLFVFDSVVAYLMFFLVVGFCMPSSSNVHTFSISNKAIKLIKTLSVTVLCVAGLIYLVFLPWQESKQWKKLLTTTRIADISKNAEGIQEISLMGNVRDTAYLYDIFFSLIEGSLDKVNDQNRQYVLATIDTLVSNLEKEENAKSPYYREELTAGKLLNLRSVVVGKLDVVADQKANAHLQNALRISPNNPMTYLALAQSRFIENDIRGAEFFTRAAIALAPEYQVSYDFADNLSKLRPDKNFTNYIQNMKTQWSPKPKTF